MDSADSRGTSNIKQALIIVLQDKVAHLNQIKSKLESTLDELESSLEKEKRGRANVEKERRKVEGDLKVTQESVADQERSKKELESSIERKEKDASVLLSKLDDEQSLVAKIQKGIKVLNHAASFANITRPLTPSRIPSSRRTRLMLRSWRKNWRRRGRLALWLRGRGPILPASLRTWESVLERPLAPPLPRLN